MKIIKSVDVVSNESVLIRINERAPLETVKSLKVNWMVGLLIIREKMNINNRNLRSYRWEEKKQKKKS